MVSSHFNLTTWTKRCSYYWVFWLGGCPLLLSGHSFLRLLFTSSLLSVSGARGGRETVEASPGCTDWEGPFNLRQHATEEGSLVQPSSHVPSARYQVARVLWLGMTCLQLKTILVNYCYFNTLHYCSLLQQELGVLPECSHLVLARYINDQL